jgi:hypothetical protein
MSCPAPAAAQSLPPFLTFPPPSLLSYPYLAQEELLAADLASAVHQMAAGGRYGELLLVADTCQASTLYSQIDAPNMLAVASSKLGGRGEWQQAA